MYRSHDTNNIIDTAQQIYKRIDERFPASGLRKICEEWNRSDVRFAYLHFRRCFGFVLGAGPGNRENVPGESGMMQRYPAFPTRHR